MNEWPGKCSIFARRLMVDAVLPAAAVALILVLLPLTFGAGEAGPVASAFAVAAGLVALALSAMIGFDSLLFRLMATHPDENTGAAAVDDILSRMRLKPRPAQLRGFQERRKGTGRLLLLQRSCVALCAAAVAFAGRAG